MEAGTSGRKVCNSNLRQKNNASKLLLKCRRVTTNTSSKLTGNGPMTKIRKLIKMEITFLQSIVMIDSFMAIWKASARKLHSIEKNTMSINSIMGRMMEMLSYFSGKIEHMKIQYASSQICPSLPKPSPIQLNFLDSSQRLTSGIKASSPSMKV